MLKFLGFSCVICVLIADDVKALDLNELKQEYMEILKQCLFEYPLTNIDIEGLEKKKTPDSKNINCFFACAFKKTGMMDDKGYLSVENVRKAAEKYMSNDPEMMKKSDEFTEACKSVNDVPVTDGDMGCERAKLIYNCSVEKAVQFDLLF